MTWRCIFAPAYSIVVEITKARDPTKTVISLIEKNNIHGCYVKSAEVRMPTEKGVSIWLRWGVYFIYYGGPDPCHLGSAPAMRQAQHLSMTSC